MVYAQFTDTVEILRITEKSASQTSNALRDAFGHPFVPQIREPPLERRSFENPHCCYL